MPRLYDATSVPSVVAIGIRNSPFACSPFTSSGPARPIGTCATPMKFSMLPRVSSGSNDGFGTCCSSFPIALARNFCRSLMIFGE